MFPQSDNAHDIADALARFAIGNGAALVQEPAVRVLVENGCVQGVETPRGQYRAPAVILACGGASYPGTGSNGDGYRLAAQAGIPSWSPAPPWCPWWPGGRTARSSWDCPCATAG